MAHWAHRIVRDVKADHLTQCVQPPDEVAAGTVLAWWMRRPGTARRGHLEAGPGFEPGLVAAESEAPAAADGLFADAWESSQHRLLCRQSASPESGPSCFVPATGGHCARGGQVGVVGRGCQSGLSVGTGCAEPTCAAGTLTSTCVRTGGATLRPPRGRAQTPVGHTRRRAASGFWREMVITHRAARRGSSGRSHATSPWISQAAFRGSPHRLRSLITIFKVKCT